MFAVQNNRIDCHSNVSNLVSLSYQISQQCLDCDHDVIDNRPVTDVNAKPFYEKGMQVYRLLEVLEKMSDAFCKNCNRCGCNNVVAKVSGGKHLFIDIECLQWLKLAANMDYENWPGVFTISQIPSRLVVGGLNYSLVSAIEYTSISDPKYVGHYVAYIRRITGRWEVQYDLCR